MDIEGSHPKCAEALSGSSKVSLDIEEGMICNLLELGGCGPEGPAREEPRSGDLSSQQ